MAVQSKSEYDRLCQEIWKHNRLYFLDNQPLISDYEYDCLLKELQQCERDHPDWIASFSPTQRVGEGITQGFQTVEHAVAMLSLANSYSKEEIGEFIRRVQEQLDREEIAFSAELKMDGVAVSVLYERGQFVRAISRGDGEKGDDITLNVKTICNLPLQLSGENIPEQIEVRGEVFMENDAFDQLNAMRRQREENEWANPRNATAGTLRLLNPKEVAERPLRVVFYSLFTSGDFSLSTQTAVHRQLGQWGLPTLLMTKRCCNEKEIWDFALEVNARRASFPFAIDGIVIKVDDRQLYSALGNTRKHPRGAIAYKFHPEEAKSQICGITIQVGRTGVITPVAELEPVELCGSVIKRATLHNVEEIQRKDIRVGDQVIIVKGGDVIPKVLSVAPSFERLPDSKAWQMPQHCPVCNSELVHDDDAVALRCPNRWDCPGQRCRRLIHFVSKAAMNIDCLGGQTLSKLIEEGFISDFASLYRLEKEPLLALEGFQEKSVENLLSSIIASKKVPLHRFLFALGIPFVGQGAARVLAQEARSLEQLRNWSKEQLLQVDGIGEKMAQSILAFFRDERSVAEVEALLHQGIAIEEPEQRREEGHFFSNKRCVLTGKLERCSRTEAASVIEQCGGKVTSQLSKQIDYLIVGNDAGSKLQRARKWNIPILSEEEFWQKVAVHN